MPRRKDIWQVGIVERSAADVIARGWDDAPVHWLAPEPAFTFIADPFGVRTASGFALFVEQYDYRRRHGTIERIDLDARFAVVDRRPALVEPWHLSWPFVFEAEGAWWMLPEAHRSGRLTLYRAHGDLADWRPECTIALDGAPIDPALVRRQGRWWLFYTTSGSREARVGALHVAWADSLTGPWTPHPGNPVRLDRGSGRPAGLPLEIDGALVLPVQDSRRTYGGAVRPLRIERLDERGFAATAGAGLAYPPGSPARCEGMHTLNAMGDLTLVDVKTIDRSLTGLALDLRRKLGGYAP